MKNAKRKMAYKGGSHFSHSSIDNGIFKVFVSVCERFVSVCGRKKAKIS